VTAVTPTLPDDPDVLKTLLLAERAESERLRQIIKELQRHRFGRRAETLPEEQLLLALEEVEQGEAAQAAQQETSAPDKPMASAKRRVNRGSLPAHLPRLETVVDIENRLCPCCAGPLHRIGEDVAERLDLVPAQFRVLVVRRPKYACRACEDGVVQAPAPARLIEGGLPSETLVAQVLVAKYADHLPLYRQAQIYARQGVQLDRSTLADWVGRAAFLLRPVQERLLQQLKASSKLFADETTAPVLDPGRGRTKTGQLFVYARDDRPWGGSDPPGVVYLYAPDRTAARPLVHLASRACCRSTAMPAIVRSPNAARSSSRSAGRMCVAGSMNSRRPARRRSPQRRWRASAHSIASKPGSAAASLRSDVRSERRKANPCSRRSSLGCASGSR
jgi:transposase